MMQTLSNAVAAVCVAAVISGIIPAVLPGKSVQKPMKTVIGIFIIAVMIAQFSGGGLNPDLDFDFRSASEENTALTETVLAQMADSIREPVNEQIEQILNQCEIFDATVETDMDISDNNRISISRIGIGLKQSDMAKSSTVKRLVNEKTGIWCDVYVSEETQ